MFFLALVSTVAFVQAETGLPECAALVANDDDQFVQFVYTLDGCEVDRSVDFVLCQDLSGSYRDDLPNVRNLWPTITADLAANYDARFGITSYSDLPIGGLGSAGAGDFPYRMDDALTSNAAESQLVVNSLATASGGDGPESQLWALYELADDDSLEWRQSSMKIVLLTTDAPPHMAGDAAGREGEIANWKTANGVDTDLTDYPSIDQLRSRLSAKNILPIFAVSSYASTYTTIVNQLGFGYVITLARDSSNLMTAVAEAMSGACATVSLIPMVDPDNRISVSPTSFRGTVGESYDFTVTVDTRNILQEYRGILGAGDGSTVGIVIQPSGSMDVTGPDGYGVCPTAAPTWSGDQVPSTKMDKKKCKPITRQVTTRKGRKKEDALRYSTREEAEAQCTADATCVGVWDKGCNHRWFFLCSTRDLRKRSRGCVYLRPE